MQEDSIKAMDPRQEPTTQINQHLDVWHKQYSVWAEECRSWYKAQRTGGRVYLWPGSLLHHLKTLKTPRFEHYDIRYHDDNIWAFLGNGRTDLELVAEVEGLDKMVLAPYIRNDDVPWSLEVEPNRIKHVEKQSDGAKGVKIEEWKEQGKESNQEVREKAQL